MQTKLDRAPTIIPKLTKRIHHLELSAESNKCVLPLSIHYSEIKTRLFFQQWNPIVILFFSHFISIFFLNICVIFFENIFFSLVNLFNFITCFFLRQFEICKCFNVQVTQNGFNFKSQKECFNFESNVLKFEIVIGILDVTVIKSICFWHLACLFSTHTQPVLSNFWTTADREKKNQHRDTTLFEHFLKNTCTYLAFCVMQQLLCTFMIQNWESLVSKMIID